MHSARALIAHDKVFYKADQTYAEAWELVLCFGGLALEGGLKKGLGLLC